MAGWDGPNRQKRQRAESAVHNAICPALRTHGGRFSVDQMVCHMSLTTRRKYLGYLVELKKLETVREGGKVFYQMPAAESPRPAPTEEQP
jgi:response regulator of citrate/malate metabolism